MRESVTYQAVLEESREEGREEDRQSMVISLLSVGVAIDQIAQAAGISIEAVTQLQQESHL